MLSTCWTALPCCTPLPRVSTAHRLLLRTSLYCDGDACGPLFFTVPVQSILETAAQSGVDWAHSYLDDSHSCGPLHALAQTLQLIRSQGRAIGLSINPTKCPVEPWAFGRATHPSCPSGSLLLSPQAQRGAARVLCISSVHLSHSHSVRKNNRVQQAKEHGSGRVTVDRSQEKSRSPIEPSNGGR